MKGLLRIFLLLFLLLLNASGFHADSFEGYDNYIPVKVPGVANSSGIGKLPATSSCIVIPVHSFFKKEYRKLRGTNEEDDEDEKSFSLKKNENPLKNKAGHNFILALSPLSFGDSNNYIKYCLSFFLHSSCESSSRCYILYQVFRI